MREYCLKFCLHAAPVALLLSSSAWAVEMYRYVNELGHTVMDYQVPAELVANGYEVVNEKGVVIRVVPRQLSEEERAARSEEQRQEEAAVAEQERLRKWDESLLLRYSTVDDIEAARERALRDLRIRVSILKGNTRSLKQQVENYQAQAADLERSGREVDMARLTAIENLRSEIASTERSIVDREREIDEVSALYQRDIDRFGQLQDMVEMRRNYSAAESR